MSRACREYVYLETRDGAMSGPLQLRVGCAKHGQLGERRCRVCVGEDDHHTRALAIVSSAASHVALARAVSR